MHIYKLEVLCFVSLLDLMLYVHGKQLSSCWAVSYFTILFLGMPPAGSLPVLSAHSSSLSDKLLFMNQRKREIIFPQIFYIKKKMAKNG